MTSQARSPWSRVQVLASGWPPRGRSLRRAPLSYLPNINTDALDAATDALTAAGRQAMGVTCDVADETQAVAMVERTVATYGRLDMAFNNAGIVGFTGDLADESARASTAKPPSTCAASVRA